MRRTAANVVYLAILLAGTVAAALIGSGYLPTFTQRAAPRAVAAVPVTVKAAALPPSAPVRLRIPAIGVDTALQPLGLLPDGSLQPPSAWQTAGWYADGVIPGQPGPAVIAGHVDSIYGPAVFYRLRQLHAGDVAIVQQRDGRTVTFVIDKIASYRKTAFPTAAVYGPTPLPVLRLITCTGDFDWQAHSYLDNLVVSAHLPTTRL